MVDGADRVLGYVFGGEALSLANGEAPDPFESEVYALYLAPGYERRGLGGTTARGGGAPSARARSALDHHLGAGAKPQSGIL